MPAVPWYATVPPDRWLAALLEGDWSRRNELFEAWVRAELDVYAQIDLLAWDRHLGRLFAELTRAIRRWCWARGWVLASGTDVVHIDVGTGKMYGVRGR